MGTSEAVAPGIFHKLTGALTSQGLEIRSAQIHTLAEGLVLDRFWVHDPDYSGGVAARSHPPINPAVEQSLSVESGQAPSFRRTWNSGEQRKMLRPKPQIRVNTDNSTSDRYTIIDVFAYDRTGLLYAVTRACSSWAVRSGGRRSAPISTRSSTSSTSPTRRITRSWTRAAGCHPAALLEVIGEEEGQ